MRNNGIKYTHMRLQIYKLHILQSILELRTISKSIKRKGKN